MFLTVPINKEKRVKYMLFSERIGAVAPQPFQIEAIDEKLTTDIWNTVVKFYLDNMYYSSSYSFENINKYSLMPISNCENTSSIKILYEEFFHISISKLDIQQLVLVKEFLEKSFFQFNWFEKLDFIEFS